MSYLSGMKRIALFCLLLLSGISAWGQKSDSWSPESLVTALKTSNRDTQSVLAKKLGIQQLFDPQQGFDNCEVGAKAAKLDKYRETSVLTVKCGYDLSVIVLAKPPDATWTKIDSMDFYAAYDRLTLEPASLIHAPLQELVIHNAAGVSGSVYQAYFLVARLLGDRLTIVFSTLETAQEPHFGGVPRHQDSTITFSPARGNEGGEISQTAKIEIGEHSYIIRRSFSWDPNIQAFVEDGVETVESRTQAKPRGARPPQ
jgi:hypothetical protein